MKKCACCKKEKPFSDFPFKNKTKNTYSTRCFVCQRQYAKNHYQANRDQYIERNHLRRKQRTDENSAYIEEYLSTHPCVDCGEKDPIVLQFDHLKDKEFGIGSYQREVDIERLKKEISKCEVRCANCHQRKTCRELGWKRRLWKAK